MLKSIKLPNLIIIILLYSGAMLYTTETIKLFYGIIFLSTVITLYYLMKRMNIVRRYFKSRYFFWMTTIWIMFFVYALIFEVYDVFNPTRLIAIYVIVTDVALLMQTFEEKNMMNEMIKNFAVVSILMMVHIFFAEFKEIISGATRIGESGTGNVNSVALYFGILSIGIFVKAFLEKNKKYMLLYILIVAFMLLTGSKKAIIIILMTIVLAFMIKNRYNFIRYIELAIVLLVMFAIVFTNKYFYNIVGYRIEDFFVQLTTEDTTTVASYSTEERGKMLKKFPELFIQSPIVGNGWGYFTRYGGFGVYSHCNYTEMLMTFGIFGTGLYYLMYLITLIKYIKLKGSTLQRIIPLISILAILVCDATSISFNSSEIYYVVLFMAVYQLSILKKEKDENV